MSSTFPEGGDVVVGLELLLGNVVPLFVGGGFGGVELLDATSV